MFFGEEKDSKRKTMGMMEKQEKEMNDDGDDYSYADMTPLYKIGQCGRTM